MKEYYLIKRKACDEYVAFYADGIGVVFSNQIADAEAFNERIAIYVLDQLHKHAQIVKSIENWEFVMVDVGDEYTTC